MATHPPTPATGIGLSLENPWLETVDLNTFERLPEPERRRVIIRVLCELVALDHPEIEGRPTDVPSEHPASPHGRVQRLRRLPFLGVEVDGARKLTGLRSSGIPHLHHQRTA